MATRTSEPDTAVRSPASPGSPPVAVVARKRRRYGQLLTYLLVVLPVGWLLLSNILHRRPARA